MRKTKINDIFAKGGFIRDDGRMVHDMYLMQVKSPDKSTEPWDYYNVVETIKGEAAWTTKADTQVRRSGSEPTLSTDDAGALTTMTRSSASRCRPSSASCCWAWSTARSTRC